METLDRKYLALLDAEPEGARNLSELRTCFSVLALAAAIDRVCAHRLQAHGLSEGRFVILVVLLAAGEALAPHDLAARIGVTRATMTGLLDGLERGGLVARRRNRHDRRSVNIALTAAGRDLAERVNEEHSTWIASLVGDLDEGERSDLQRLLARIWRRADAASFAPQPRVVSGGVHENR